MDEDVFAGDGQGSEDDDIRFSTTQCDIFKLHRLLQGRSDSPQDKPTRAKGKVPARLTGGKTEAATSQLPPIPGGHGVSFLSKDRGQTDEDNGHRQED